MVAGERRDWIWSVMGSTGVEVAEVAAAAAAAAFLASCLRLRAAAADILGWSFGLVVVVGVFAFVVFLSFMWVSCDF